MSTQAYAVAIDNNVIVHSIRHDKGEARCAAMNALKSTGTWKDLEAEGYRVVPVVVRIAQSAPDPPAQSKRDDADAPVPVRLGLARRVKRESALM